MLRRIHSLPALVLGLLIAVLAISGAILSVNPTIDRLGTTVPERGQVSVALLAERIAENFVGVEQIQRSPSGSIIVYYSQDDRAEAMRVDPLSGKAIGPYAPSPATRWIKNLHRSFLADTPGRAAAGISALTMLVLCVSGMALLLKRVGGWRHLLRPLRGSLSQRWHSELGRIALLGLLLSALTGILMSATTFGLIPEGADTEPAFPTAVETPAAPVPVGTLPALLEIDLQDLRELVYPMPDTPSDFYSLATAQGDGYIDQATGVLLVFRPHDRVQNIHELIYRLHTGEGLWWLGLLLGVCALSVPVMSATGVVMWWQRRRLMPRIANNSGAQAADTVILVGSEGNSTWGFANALHDALHKAGKRVHTAPMNLLAGEYRQARRLFVLTATYGDGDAPTSARQFLARLGRFSGDNNPAFAVLGFGDRQFPRFCQFARDAREALLGRGWTEFLELDTVDRQSSQEFARWGEAVERALSLKLGLTHVPSHPQTCPLELISRMDYGAQVNAPTSILRFGPVASPSAGGRLRRMLGTSELPHFDAGDLVGIVAPGSPVPRFYSLASGSSDGFLEICVRKHPGGLCSGMLHDLQPGARIDAFIQPNPDFRPASGKSPVVLIGAGTGIGPLAGFIRNNTGKHPMYLYWGGRDPASDFLYEPELDGYLADHRLTGLNAIFSRTANGGYVQDRLLDHSSQMRRLIEDGAQILVCGGRAMADSIRQTIDAIVAPIGLDVATLKLQGRYREDVF
ncbi:PepSY domain-containing protein [Lysobacter sp. H21R4]|uniref:PepSY domain-containing protein n=1 Tax=Lysobacter sp. H21R4 TaxID=2781021 RepID=UPI0018891A1E|nr:PepSY domain-containing protein [Lysobacter sp. H21R4]QOY61682.1 PepSY domain-containing protein [Lysobacter sp. H21R4]